MNIRLASSPAECTSWETYRSVWRVVVSYTTVEISRGTLNSCRGVTALQKFKLAKFFTYNNTQLLKYFFFKTLTKGIYVLSCKYVSNIKMNLKS